MRSLGWRLTLWYVTAVMATMLAALLVGRWLLNKELMTGIDLLNAAEFQEIPLRLGSDPRMVTEANLLPPIAQEAKLDAALYVFMVRRADGTVVFRSDNLAGADLPKNPPGVRNWTGRVESIGMFRIAQFNAGSLTVQVASQLKSVGRLYRSYFNVALVMLTMVLVLSIFLGMWLNRLALAPIRRIQRTAARISADNLSERIPVVDGDDEITGLARLLNQMFDRLERSFFQLWRFAGNASHELKTPLSIIRLQSEKLLMHGNLAPGQQESVQQQLESIARLSTVIEKLLFLAKSEVGAIDMNLLEQSTGNLVKAFSEDALVLCEEGRVRFVIARNTEVMATFDAALLRQVLLNLLGNALRVTPAGGEIILSSWEQHQQWVVTLEDTGPGLPASKLEEVFEPFVRVQGADSGSEGAGLGLAICRSILSLHHGQIYGANRQPGPGFCITLEIPLTRPVQSLSGTPRMSSSSHSSGGSSAADAGTFVRRQPSPAQNKVP